MWSSPKMAALVLTVWLGLLGNSEGRTAPLVKRETSHYCGSNLVQALQLVCNSEYQTLYKKANHDDAQGQVEDYGEDSFRPEDVPLLLFPVEMHLASRGVRVRRGVSDECCYRRCSIAVLKSYCA